MDFRQEPLDRQFECGIETEHLPGLVGNPEQTAGDIDLPKPGIGGSRRQVETLLGRTQGQIGFPSLQGTYEDFTEQTQMRNELFRPVAFLFLSLD